MKLACIADELDQAGFTREANQVDSVMVALAQFNGDQDFDFDDEAEADAKMLHEEDLREQLFPLVSRMERDLKLGKKMCNHCNEPMRYNEGGYLDLGLAQCPNCGDTIDLGEDAEKVLRQMVTQ